MALPATHLRFALDLAPRFPVTHMGRYISGTMYPDSRWITARKRQETHNVKCLDPKFAITNFFCGWHVHCLCDHIQSLVYKSLFQQWECLTPTDRWIKQSVAKMLQDMADMPCVDMNTQLVLMKFPETPNEEDSLQVQRYYDIIEHIYADKAILSLGDYHELWLRVGLEPDRAREVMDQMEIMLDNRKLLDAIAGIYPKMMKQTI